jgi:hypothetical protein
VTVARKIDLRAHVEDVSDEYPPGDSVVRLLRPWAGLAEGTDLRPLSSGFRGGYNWRKASVVGDGSTVYAVDDTVLADDEHVRYEGRRSKAGGGVEGAW